MVLIIAIVGIIGSLFAGTLSSGLLDLFGNHATHEAFAGDFPLLLDHKYKLKEKSGDAKVKASSLEVFDNSIIDPDQHCEFCSLVRYTPGAQEYAGIAYITDSPMDLTKATRATVIVKGEEGGEKIQLGIAGKKVKGNGEAQYAIKTKPITLTDDWMPIQIDLTKALKKDMIDVTHPFEIQVLKSKQGTSAVYFKYVAYDLEPAQGPIETIASQ